MSIIEIENVTKTFQGHGGSTTALSDINLNIQPREFVTLLGPSGCGKSTLLRVIADLAEPTQGTVVVNGKTPRQARLARDYGMVFQQAGLFEWRTVTANIEVPLQVAGTSRSSRQVKAREMLDLVQLNDFAQHYPWQLSGGMQQRVAIARALSTDPQILLMDEPLGALDEMNRERLQAELLRIWTDTHTTVVFVTHSVSEAVFLSSRVVIMSPRPGRIAESIDNTLSYPRTAESRVSAEYFEMVTKVRSSLHGVLKATP